MNDVATELPVEGSIRYNPEHEFVEIFRDGDWKIISAWEGNTSTDIVVERTRICGKYSVEFSLWGVYVDDKLEQFTSTKREAHRRIKHLLKQYADGLYIGDPPR